MRDSFKFRNNRELVLIAPDEASVQNEPFWNIRILGSTSKFMSNEGLMYAEDTKADALWTSIKSLLYGLISSSEVDTNLNELEEFITSVHAKYHASKNAHPPTT